MLYYKLNDFHFRPSYDWMRVISVRNPTMRTNRKVSLVFNHLEPKELADHLTFLEHKIFRRLNVSYDNNNGLFEHLDLRLHDGEGVHTSGCVSQI